MKDAGRVNRSMVRAVARLILFGRHALFVIEIV
jgi:hypothetical protein